jgi:hypothetical protein
MTVNHITTTQNRKTHNKKKSDLDAFTTSSSKKRRTYKLACMPAKTVPESVDVENSNQRESNLATSVASRDEKSNNNTAELISEVTFDNLRPNGTVPVAQKWNDAQLAIEKDNDRISREINNFVKKVLFKKFKFVTNPTEMHFSESKKSLCQFSCNELNILTSNRPRFWKNWSRRIEQTLSRRRSDINSGMKEEFLGKFIFLTIVQV